MKYFITGAAGFIGSHLADQLLDEGHEVVGWDDFSTGQERFVENARRRRNYQLMKGDNLDLEGLKSAMKGCEQVFHFAANADVRFGLEHPSKDIQQNTIATFHVLEAMRFNDIGTVAFASTGSVYGETSVIPTPEDAPFPIQTSLYGASKVAAEALIEAYCEGYGFRGLIFRLVSILGERYTHGHIFDFYRQLLDHPERLQVLGDGNQRKSYLYISDCIDAMLHVMRLRSDARDDNRIEIYNLGTTEYVESWIRSAGSVANSPSRHRFASLGVGRVGSVIIRSFFWIPQKFRRRVGTRKSVFMRAWSAHFSGCGKIDGYLPSVLIECWISEVQQFSNREPQS